MKRLIAFGFVLATYVAAAASAESEDIDWGPSVAGVEVSLRPVMESFEPFDPLAFILTIRNNRDDEVGFRTGVRMKAGEHPRPDSVRMDLSGRIDGVPETSELLITLGNQSGSNAPFEGSSSRLQRAATTIAPGKEFAVAVYLETDLLGRRIGTDTTASYELAATFYPDRFTVNGRSLADLVQDPDRRIESNTARFVMTPAKGGRQIRKYHDTLNLWWEWLELTLTDDGRFVFRTLGGGECEVVKGRYQETSDTIRLEAVVNGDVPLFVKRQVWTKVQVGGRWDALMLPKSAAKWNPKVVPDFYPVLHPVDSSEPRAGRPWE